MSKIDDLISKYCPNGVESVPLGDLLDYEQPIRYIVKSTRYQDNGTPVLTAGQTFVLGYTSESDGIFKASTDNPVIIFDDFTTSNQWVDFSFKVKSSAMKMLKIKKEGVLLRYVYYAMNTIRYDSLEHSRKWISIYSNIKIPLPPLSVQQEIVRILDGFSELEKELEKELVARRKQYEYYRNQLVSFGEGGNHACDVKLVKLEDLFELRNGYTPSKTNSSFWEDGMIPWFRMEDIRTNGRILSDSIQHITNKAVKQGALFPADSIIVAVSATIGEHALITVEALANQRFVCLSKKEEYINDLNMKYFYYYMFLIDEWCKNNTNVSGFASVDMAKFKKIQIPIPPLAEQERIVAILDKFDALVNDISVGLPAELKARRKQYEYWRNKLLDFKEAV